MKSNKQKYLINPIVTDATRHSIFQYRNFAILVDHAFFVKEFLTGLVKLNSCYGRFISETHAFRLDEDTIQVDIIIRFEEIKTNFNFTKDERECITEYVNHLIDICNIIQRRNTDEQVPVEYEDMEIRYLNVPFDLQQRSDGKEIVQLAQKFIFAENDRRGDVVFSFFDMANEIYDIEPLDYKEVDASIVYKQSSPLMKTGMYLGMWCFGSEDDKIIDEYLLAIEKIISNEKVEPLYNYRFHLFTNETEDIIDIKHHYQAHAFTKLLVNHFTFPMITDTKNDFIQFYRDGRGTIHVYFKYLEEDLPVKKLHLNWLERFAELNNIDFETFKLRYDELAPRYYSPFPAIDKMDYEYAGQVFHRGFVANHKVIADGRLQSAQTLMLFNNYFDKNEEHNFNNTMMVSFVNSVTEKNGYNIYQYGCDFLTFHDAIAQRYFESASFELSQNFEENARMNANPDKKMIC